LVKNLRECRADEGLSQQVLAKILKTSLSNESDFFAAVSNGLRVGDLKPLDFMLKKIEDALDTTIDFLINGNNEKRPKHPL